MSPTSSLFHVLKDQIRTVKYSIRAEANAPGSMVPRSLQSREMRRLTSLGSVVSLPAFRLADGLVTRVEAIAMDLLGSAARTDRDVAPVDAYLSDGFEFTGRLFGLLKRVVEAGHGPSAFVSEQALDTAWTAVSKRVAPGTDPVLACAILADAVGRAGAVRQLGHRPGPETSFSAAPALHSGLVAGLMISVATVNPAGAGDTGALLESASSVVDARFERFRRAVAGEAPAEAIAAEFRKLTPFLP